MQMHASYVRVKGCTCMRIMLNVSACFSAEKSSDQTKSAYPRLIYPRNSVPLLPDIRLRRVSRIYIRFSLSIDVVSIRYLLCISLQTPLCNADWIGIEAWSSLLKQSHIEIRFGRGHATMTLIKQDNNSGKKDRSVLITKNL